MFAAVVERRRLFPQPGIVGQAERVVDVGIGPVAATTCAQGPNRATPGRIGPDVGLDLFGAEAGELVPFLVVFTDMLETEPAVLVQPVPGPWRTVFALQSTAGRLADALMRLRTIGLHQGFRSPS